MGQPLHPIHVERQAVKGHYYNSRFYNHPYTFGPLFGLGLYAQYQKEPDAFRADYDEFLSSAGMFDVVTLGKRFGADIQNVDFWRSNLDVIRGLIGEYEGTAGRAMRVNSSN